MTIKILFLFAFIIYSISLTCTNPDHGFSYDHKVCSSCDGPNKLSCGKCSSGSPTEYFYYLSNWRVATCTGHSNSIDQL